MCTLHLDYSFSSCFLHWHSEDAPEGLPSQTPPASKILKEESKSKAQTTAAPAGRQSEAGQDAAETGGLQEGTEASHHSGGVTGDRSDVGTEQQLQQDGGLIKKSD